MSSRIIEFGPFDTILCLSCTIACARELEYTRHCRNRNHARIRSRDWRARDRYKTYSASTNGAGKWEALGD